MSGEQEATGEPDWVGLLQEAEDLRGTLRQRERKQAQLYIRLAECVKVVTGLTFDAGVMSSDSDSDSSEVGDSLDSTDTSIMVADVTPRAGTGDDSEDSEPEHETLSVNNLWTRR